MRLAVAPAGVPSCWLDREGPARPLDGGVPALRPQRSPSCAEGSKVAGRACSPLAPPRSRPGPQALGSGPDEPQPQSQSRGGPSPVSALSVTSSLVLEGLGGRRLVHSWASVCPSLGPGSSVLHGGALGSAPRHHTACLPKVAGWSWGLRPVAWAGQAWCTRAGWGSEPLRCTSLGEPVRRDLGFSAGPPTPDFPRDGIGCFLRT